MTKIVDIAHDYIGCPAIRFIGEEHGMSKQGFDCSGFVRYVLEEARIFIPISPVSGKKCRRAVEFYDYFGYHVHDEAACKGDLVFFSRHGVMPSHVGIYLGNNMMIHSPGQDNEQVEICSLEKRIDLVHDEMMGEQIYFRNPIGFKRPKFKLLF